MAMPLEQSGPHGRVVVLGSTGSIGTQVLDVIARNPKRFRVAARGRTPDILAAQIQATG